MVLRRSLLLKSYYFYRIIMPNRPAGRAGNLSGRR